MHLTKAWVFILGLTVAAALTLALVVPRPALRELEKEEGARLQQSQRSAQLLLKINARSKMDLAAQLSGDSILSGALEEIARGGKDKALHRTALERLRVFNQKLKLDFLMVLDPRGRVLARATASGEGDASDYNDSMAGFPLVADALRGYRGEDAWAQGDSVYRVAASPMLSRAHDRYVGALVLGAKVGEDLAKSLHDKLGADVAFFLRGKVLTSTVSTPALHQLTEVLQRHTEDVVAIDHYLAIATPLAGEAALQEASYVLLLPRSEGTGLASFLRAATPREDLKGVPWLFIGGMTIVMLTVAFGLVWLESEGPLARLRDDAARLAAGDLPKLDDGSYRGRFGAVVRSVNGALERLRVAAEISSPSVGIQPGLGPGYASRLGAPPSDATLSGGYDLPVAQAPMGSGSAPRVAPPLPQTAAQSTAAAPPPFFGDGRKEQSGLGTLPPLPQLDAIPLESNSLAASGSASQGPGASAGPGAGSSGRVVAPKRSMPVPVKPPSTPPLLPAGRAGRSASGIPATVAAQVPPPRRPTPLGLPLEPDLLDLAGAETLPGQSTLPGQFTLPGPTPLPAGSRSGAMGSEGKTPLPSAMADEGDPGFGVATLVSEPSRELRDQSRRDDEEIDGYFRKVFKDFVELKRKCGESVDNVTFEKFSAKLRDNREQLMHKLACRSVKFQVYVKDGRAALKATPVRE